MKLKVTNLNEPMRIDKYLATQLDHQSRSQIEILINEQCVLVNSHIVKRSYRVNNDDEIIIKMPEVKPSEHIKEMIPFDVIYEDDHLIIINKPPGIVTHPAGGHLSGTLVNGLLYRFPELSSINGINRPGIVHRLDKDTSGILIVAKNDYAHRFIAEQLAKRTMGRYYYALVKGIVYEDSGTINAPLARDSRYREKIAVNIALGKEAISEFKVIHRYEHQTLLSVQLITGRTHQIRVHLAYINRPIVGDKLYGGHDKLYTHGQLLHAYKLVFIHPDSKKEVTFEVGLPPYFESVIQSLTPVDL